MTKWNALQKERTTEASLLADLFQEADAIVEVSVLGCRHQMDSPTLEVDSKTLFLILSRSINF